jgi:ABC-2 type transport system ATP-binding protein
VCSSDLDAGVTVLLTTQYLEEADQLADRVVVVDAGQVIAEGTPDELKRKVGGERLSVTLVDAAQSAAAVSALSRVGAEAAVAAGERVVQVGLAPGIGAIAEAAAALAALGVEVEDFGVRRPSLDDVFLALTGHGAAA